MRFSRTLKKTTYLLLVATTIGLTNLSIHPASYTTQSLRRKGRQTEKARHIKRFSYLFPYIATSIVAISVGYIVGSYQKSGSQQTLPEKSINLIPVQSKQRLNQLSQDDLCQKVIGLTKQINDLAKQYNTKNRLNQAKIADLQKRFNPRTTADTRHDQYCQSQAKATYCKRGSITVSEIA